MIIADLHKHGAKSYFNNYKANFESKLRELFLLFRIHLPCHLFEGFPMSVVKAKKDLMHLTHECPI